MKLFERVKLLAKHHKMTIEALANRIGLPKSTLHNYFSEQTEHHLFGYLEAILTVFPGVSRVWLYCEEGEMLVEGGDGGERVIVKPSKRPAEDEVAALRAENDALKDKLIAAQEGIIHLHEQLARMGGDGGFTHHADGERPAPGVRQDGIKE